VANTLLVVCLWTGTIAVLDFLAIQETKMEAILYGLIYSLWENNDCGWAYLPTVGYSGMLRLSLCLLSYEMAL
jgi:hypothetical protein